MKFKKLKSLILIGLIGFSLINVNQVKCENSIKKTLINTTLKFINQHKDLEQILGFSGAALILWLGPMAFLLNSLPRWGGNSHKDDLPTKGAFISGGILVTLAAAVNIIRRNCINA